MWLAMMPLSARRNITISLRTTGNVGMVNGFYGIMFYCKEPIYDDNEHRSIAPTDLKSHFYRFIGYSDVPMTRLRKRVATRQPQLPTIDKEIHVPLTCLRKRGSTHMKDSLNTFDEVDM